MTNPTAHGVSVFDGLVDAPSDLSAAIARVRAATTFADGEPMPDGALPHDDFYCGELRTLIAAAERAAAPVAWQPIATAPEGRVVLVFYKNQLGNGRTMRARYYLPETLESEQTESGWADEGWYEESEAYEYLMPLEHEPTHWMPMPAAPDAAPPAQAEPQHVSVSYELPAHAEPQPAPTPNPGPIGSSLGVAAPDVAALVKRFGERARGANDNAQRGGDADAQVWSIVAQDYRDARAMLTAQQARIDALASSRDAAVRLWNEAGEEIEALKHDNGRMVERGQKEFHTPTIWYAGKSSHPDDARYNGRWTENANRAIRFSTQSECEATVYNEFMRYWGDKRVNCHASEHVFLSQELTYSTAITAERTRCAAIARAHGAEDAAREMES